MKRYLALIFATLSLQAHADCFDMAAKRQSLNPQVLRAIARVESKMDPKAINHNKNGSTDIGIMQVNTIHMPELNAHGIKKKDLYHACTNIEVAAWLLRKKVDKYGPTWAAIGAYHSETPTLRDAYARLVHTELKNPSILTDEPKIIRLNSV